MEKTIIPLLEKFKETNFYNFLEANFTNEQIGIMVGVTFGIILILTLILSLILGVRLIVKLYKHANKKEWLIGFCMKDSFSVLGMLFFAITILLLRLAITNEGSVGSLIFPIILFGIIGIYGLSWQKERYRIYKKAGYKGFKLIFRMIFNFICGIVCIPFLGVGISLWILKYFFGWLSEPNISENGDSDNKRRIKSGYIINEKGETILTNTYNITDHYSETVFIDNKGKEHTIKEHKY